MKSGKLVLKVTNYEGFIKNMKAAFIAYLSVIQVFNIKYEG